MKANKIVVLDAGSIGDDVDWSNLYELGSVAKFDDTLGSNFEEHVGDAEIILTNKVPISKNRILSAPNLKYIGVMATGYNHVDLETASKQNITVCNVPDYSSYSVMQHTFALILALSSKICLHVDAVANGEWEKSTHFCFWKQPLHELSSKTLGVVGFGNTGSLVAQMGHFFNMNVVAYAPNPKPLPSYKPFEFVSLDKLFEVSDIISLNCPATPQNTGFVNYSLIKKMKKNAILINCSRGILVNEEDLAKALKEGLIAGAGLDVVAKEPMLANNPLKNAPNCIITPHIAWSSVESRQRLIHGVCDNIKMFLNNTPKNIVTYK